MSRAMNFTLVTYNFVGGLVKHHCGHTNLYCATRIETHSYLSGTHTLNEANTHSTLEGEQTSFIELQTCNLVMKNELYGYSNLLHDDE